MRKIVLLVVNILALFSSPSAHAGEVSFSWGEGTSRWYFKDQGELVSDAFRIAYIHESDYQWSFSNDSEIKLELEFGVYHWRDPWLPKQKYGAVITPMWRYYYPVFNQKLYAGLGIGLSYTNYEYLMDRELGSRLLFEDRFEAGIVIANKHRISLSLNHYSNANLADKNHGINYYFVNYAYAF